MYRKITLLRLPRSIDLPCCSSAHDFHKSSFRVQYLDPNSSHSSTTHPSVSFAAKPIEMVSEKLHRHLFPSDVPSISAKDESIQLELPRLRKETDLMGHFDAIGSEQFKGYEELLLSGSEIKSLPPFPNEWTLSTGWTKYDPELGVGTPVEFPDEDLLFFDVEVCVLDGQLPTMAIALSPTAWYSWCSDRLVNGSDVPETTRLKHLIQLEPENGINRSKIVVGHNVAYDRARVREQYFSNKTMTCFWDTMSMSIAIYGMADHQRIMYEKTDLTEGNKPAWLDAWRQRVCKNGLGAVHQKLCGATTKLKLEKSLQDFFVKQDMNAIRDSFQSLMQYCAEDVYATFEVFQALYPTFRQRFPHPISSVGMMEITSAYLPITSNWRKFYEKCEKDSSKSNDNAAQQLAGAIKDLYEKLETDQEWAKDPWMWISDWKLNKRLNKPKWYLNMFSSSSTANDFNMITAKDVKQRARDFIRVFGLCYGPYPMFFKAEHGWGFLKPHEPVPDDFLEFEKVKTKRGDEVLLPNKAILDLIDENQTRSDVQIIPIPERLHGKVGIFDFYKLPHKKNPNANVGTPFSIDYKEEFEHGILWATRYSHILKGLLDSQGITRFWGNYRARYLEQLTVWLDDEKEIGAIAPSVIPSGTVTRRSVHKLWMTSANPKEGLLGSELKSMVQCTDGWKIVGADVDSQEQWIAATLGDSAFEGRHAGGTQFSNMLLAGNKADKTDLHSVVAKEVGISRDNAKVLNYARLYGSSERHAVTFLRQQNPIKEEVAKRVSEKLFRTTKGQKMNYFELSPESVSHFREYLKSDGRYKDQHIFILDRYFLPCYGHKNGQLTLFFEEWVKKRLFLENNQSNGNALQEKLRNTLYKNYPQKIELYKGGFESYTFNYLELMLLEPELKTPILHCRLSQALEPLPHDVPDAEEFMKTYKRSIINWCVQSSAVDFLHMLIVCMSWLCNEYEIRARFVLSIHDEVRYLVAEEDKYRCALAMTLSNMYVRAAISQRLGIQELPQSVAFFSQVDIDTVLRKEVNIKCTTPDGQEIPPGEALTMDKIIEKTAGSLTKK
uniref:Mitochondrial DNA polymerase catalytic subunit n=1 Tax=Acrobeloides nanus TaxID=290746 RepID=A0A914EJ92_9BILA